MQNKKYKNIVFDMGNVLIYYTPRKYVELLGLENKEDELKLYNAVYRSRLNPYLDRGDYNEEQFVNEVSKELPDRFYEYVHRLIFHWADVIKPMEGMADFIKDIKEKGYKIYLLSNAGYNQHDYWERVPGHEYFDGGVVSCDVRMIKPERRIYEELYKRFDLRPEESFFIDDLPLNIYGAYETGMEGFVFNGNTDELRKFFVDNNLL